MGPSDAQFIRTRDPSRKCPYLEPYDLVGLVGGIGF